jgi:SAM-dependent methyltransferase
VTKPHTGARRREDGFRRSLRLLNAFRVEQTDPCHFYGLLADDTVHMIEEHGGLEGRTVLDVGAGPPEFAVAFAQAGANYFALDADRRELGGDTAAATVLADGRHLPFRDATVDVCTASNVLEHVSQPWALADEMVRVTRPDGLVVVSYTNWLSPWGGHETSPWHYLGGYLAADRYGRRYGHPPKNRYGVDLFPVSVAAGLRWVRTNDRVEVLDARPRYLPRWGRALLRIPAVREVVTWNLWLVLRRR